MTISREETKMYNTPFINSGSGSTGNKTAELTRVPKRQAVIETIKKAKGEATYAAAGIDRQQGSPDIALGKVAVWHLVRGLEQLENAIAKLESVAEISQPQPNIPVGDDPCGNETQRRKVARKRTFVTLWPLTAPHQFASYIQ